MLASEPLQWSYLKKFALKQTLLHIYRNNRVIKKKIYRNFENWKSLPENSLVADKIVGKFDEMHMQKMMQ